MSEDLTKIKIVKRKTDRLTKVLMGARGLQPEANLDAIAAAAEANTYRVMAENAKNAAEQAAELTGSNAVQTSEDRAVVEALHQEALDAAQTTLEHANESNAAVTITRANADEASTVLNSVLSLEDSVQANADAAIQAKVDSEANVVITGNSATAANTAKNVAITAKDGAVAAKDTAINAKTYAEIARQAAEDALAGVESIFDSFDDRYLGKKSVDPSTDNDGDPLVEGQVYWNSTDNVLKFFNGFVWDAPIGAATTAAGQAVAAAQAALVSEQSSAAWAQQSENSATQAAGNTEEAFKWAAEYEDVVIESEEYGLLLEQYTGTNYIASPFDPDSWSAADPDGSVTNITLDNPSGADVLGECVITSGNLTFITTVSSFNSIAGEKIYCCFIVKNIDASNVFVRFQSDAGTDNQTQINLTTLNKVTGNSTVLVTSLSNGFSLVQVERTTTTDLTNVDVLVYANGDGGTFYAQAAYFGKANDWPAVVNPVEYSAKHYATKAAKSKVLTDAVLVEVQTAKTDTETLKSDVTVLKAETIIEKEAAAVSAENAAISEANVATLESQAQLAKTAAETAKDLSEAAAQIAVEAAWQPATSANQTFLREGRFVTFGTGHTVVDEANISFASTNFSTIRSNEGFNGRIYLEVEVTSNDFVTASESLDVGFFGEDTSFFFGVRLFPSLNGAIIGFSDASTETTLATFPIQDGERFAILLDTTQPDQVGFSVVVGTTTHAETIPFVHDADALFTAGIGQSGINNGSSSVLYNIGNRPFEYAVPSGYQPLGIALLGQGSSTAAGGGESLITSSNLFDNALSQVEDLTKGTINISRDNTLTSTPAASSFFTRYIRSNYVWSNKLYFEITPIQSDNAWFEMLFSMINYDGTTQYNRGVKIGLNPDGNAYAYIITSGDGLLNRGTANDTLFAINASAGDVVGFSINTSKELDDVQFTVTNVTKSLSITKTIVTNLVNNNNGLDVTVYASTNTTASFDLNFGQKPFTGEIPEGFTAQARVPFVKNTQRVTLWAGSKTTVSLGDYSLLCDGVYSITLYSEAVELDFIVEKKSEINKKTNVGDYFLSSGNTAMRMMGCVYSPDNRSFSAFVYNTILSQSIITEATAPVTKLTVTPF